MDSLQQCSQGRPLMIMGDLSMCPAPQPLDPIGVRVVGRGIEQPQVLVPLRQRLADQLGACRGMGPQVGDDDQSAAATSTRPSDSGPDLGAKDIGSAAWGQAAFKPAVTPVDEPKAIDLVMGSRGFYPALSAAAFATPLPSQGRMKRQLDL